MHKSLLRQQVLERLAEALLRVEQAAQTAHEAAIHEENIAENKYDTLVVTCRQHCFQGDELKCHGL